MDATLCILAGGEGRRMGRPKAEIFVRGQPILGYLLERIHWEGETMLVTAPSRRSPPGAERFHREIVDPTDGEGPLRGVLTALQSLTTPLAIVATVDMPGIGPAQMHWLQEQLNREATTTLGVMCRRKAHVEPFPSIFRAQAVDEICQQFSNGQRSVAALTKLPRFAAIDAPQDWDELTWTNLNTDDDVKRFVARLHST